MSMFTEDPTLPVAVLLMAAVCCFVALRTRQEGKYLVWGTSALAAAAAVAAFEWFWVTDRERIEGVVYDVRRALLASDAQAVLACLTPQAQYVQSGSSLSPETTRALILGNVAAAKFDVVRIHALQTSAGRRTRRGKADLKVFVRGDVLGPMGFGSFSGAADSAWSLGFEETRPGVWKINRITPISTPFNPAALAAAAIPRDLPAVSPLATKSLPFDPTPGLRDRGEFRVTRKTLARDRQRRYDRVAPEP